MKDKDCDLCNKVTVHSGKDKLLFEDDFCYIVENGNTLLYEGTKITDYKRRISLALKHHIADPDEATLTKAYDMLRDYVRHELNIVGFFVKKTMGTYPDHFHIHAYVLPPVTRNKSRRKDEKD